MGNLANNTTSCTVAEKESPLNEFIQRIHNETDRINGVAENVGDVTDRLAGSVEKDPPDSADRPEPVCEFEKLNYAIIRLSSAVDCVNSESCRLSEKV